MVVTLYDKFVCLPITEPYWANECKGFIENYEFPFVGEWGGFHVHVASRLKNYFSFKTNTRLRVWVWLLIIKDSCILPQVHLVAHMMPDC